MIPLSLSSLPLFSPSNEYLSLPLSPKGCAMHSNTYLAVRGIARFVTKALCVTVPVAVVFLAEGWAQTW